jgi:hypothetical protein
LELELAAGHLRNASVIAFLAGDIAGAEAHLQRGVDALVRFDDKGHLASCAPHLAQMLLERGDRDREALAMAELGESSSIEDDVDAQVRWRSAKARALSRLGEQEEGERLARSSVERAWTTDYPNLRALSLEALAEVLHRTGTSGEAVEAMERAITVYEQKGNIAAAAIARRRLTQLQSTPEASGPLGR